MHHPGQCYLSLSIVCPHFSMASRVMTGAFPPFCVLMLSTSVDIRDFNISVMPVASLYFSRRIAWLCISNRHLLL